MSTFEESSFVGNLELCGDPLKKKYSDYKVPQYNSPLPEVNEEEEEESESKDVWWGFRVGLSYGVGFAGVVSVLVVQIQWRRRLFEAMDGFIAFLFFKFSFNR